MESSRMKSEQGAGGGMHVYIDHCLICNNQCFLPPKPDLEDRQRIVELRELFYEVYEIPVTSSFISACSDDLPLCAGCTFKLGRLKILHEQLTSIQREYIRLREGIAFNMVDFVASNDGDKWGSSMELRSMPPEVIQRYLRKAEVDTLQHIIFEEWHERYSTDLEEKFNVNSFLPSSSRVHEKIKMENGGRPPMKRSLVSTNSISQPVKVIRNASGNVGKKTQSHSNTINRSASLKSNMSLPVLPKSLINGKSNATASVQADRLGRKTTVISITTHDDGDASKKNASAAAILKSKKRKLEPMLIKQEDKKAKSIEIVVGDDENEAQYEGTEGDSSVGDESDMVISMSPSRFQNSGDGNSPDVGQEYAINESDEDNQLENGQGPNKRNGQRNNDESTSSPTGPEEQEMDYENMNFGDLTEFLENAETEDMDPERQQYLENIIAQLQAGGNNIEFQQNEEGLYVCMFCNKTFIHKYPYRDHLKTHTGEGPRCPICQKIFPKNHNLMLHLRTHTGEKPFLCNICNKGFADKSNLKVHYRVHTGEKPYKCDHCDLAFVNSSRLVVHRRLHTGERPFPCEFCSKSFSTSNQLATHRKIHGVVDQNDSGEVYSNLV